MAQSLTSLHGDLLITIYTRASTRYHGTAAQLISEGLIPDGFNWPQGSSTVSFSIGKFTHWIGRRRPKDLKGPMSIWIHGDYWFLDRSLTSEHGHQWRNAELYEKTMALSEVILRNSPEREHTFFRALEARKDKKYQAFRLQVLGEQKRGRGRPTKKNRKEQNQGEMA